MIYTKAQKDVLRYALSELVELLKSPTSADRDADPAHADHMVEVAQQLINDLPAAQTRAAHAMACLEAIHLHDARLCDAANDGKGARSPTGDDYNDVFALAMTGRDGLRSPPPIPSVATAYSSEQDPLKTLMFVRHDRASVCSVGLLSVRTSLEDHGATMAALVGSTTDWVKSTDAGKHTWIGSCEDLNIGDLASSSAFTDPVFLEALRKRGIHFVDCVLGDGDFAFSYDKVLVDANAVAVAPL